MVKPTRARNLPLLTDEEVEARRPVLLAGIDQYNSGYFFEAHETWEELWLQSPWPFREFLQGMIQVAAAFVHLMRHEYPGVIRLLDEALAKLEDASMTIGVDAKRLVAEARAARAELAALGPERFEEWDQRRIPQIRLLSEKR
jgi:predicted metal-dependent hydrolase